MEDYLTMWSILLAVASTTLAIAAFIFSWASYKSASNMLIKSQEILAQISQKVEVVVERTTHQIDRAWDYFTGVPSASLSKGAEEIAKKEDELKRQIIEEARKETIELMKGAGLQKEALNELIEKVENLVGKSSERTRQLLQRERILSNISKIEETLRELAAENGVRFPKQMSLKALARNFSKLEKLKFIHTNALKDLEMLISFQDEEVIIPSEQGFIEILSTAVRLLDYLLRLRKQKIS